MINVYVAGASRNKERARAFMDLVRAHPAMILTHDWVADIDAADIAGMTDADLDDPARAAFAEGDLNGLAEADVAVFLLEDETVSRGMYVELGYAIAVRESCHEFIDERETPRPGIKPRIIVSGGDKQSIFTVPGLVDYESTYSVVAIADEISWNALVAEAEASESDVIVRFGPDICKACGGSKQIEVNDGEHDDPPFRECEACS